MRRVLKQILLFILVTAILFTNIQISQAAGTGTVRVNDFYQMKSQEESTIKRKRRVRKKEIRKKIHRTIRIKKIRKKRKKKTGKKIRKKRKIRRML